VILKKRNWSAELCSYVNVQFTDSVGETLSDLVATGAVMCVTVLGGGGCLNDGTSDVYRSY
jgi:hypothetical protein